MDEGNEAQIPDERGFIRLREERWRHMAPGVEYLYYGGLRWRTTRDLALAEKWAHTSGAPIRKIEKLGKVGPTLQNNIKDQGLEVRVPPAAHSCEDAIVGRANIPHKDRLADLVRSFRKYLRSGSPKYTTAYAAYEDGKWYGLESLATARQYAAKDGQPVFKITLDSVKEVPAEEAVATRAVGTVAKPLERAGAAAPELWWQREQRLARDTRASIIALHQEVRAIVAGSQGIEAEDELERRLLGLEATPTTRESLAKGHNTNTKSIQDLVEDMIKEGIIIGER